MPRPETMWDATQPDKAQLEEEERIEEDVTRSPVTPKPGAEPAKDGGRKSDISGGAV